MAREPAAIADQARVPTYSVRLLLPFLRVLAERPSFPREQLADMEALDPDGRIPVALCDRALQKLIETSGDPALPLTAGLRLEPGESGAFDYALSTAATLREAIELVSEYMHLVSDAFRASLVVEGGLAHLCIGSDVPLSEASADFRLTSFFAVHARHWCSDPRDLTVWLTRSEPANSDAYVRAFAPAKVRFLADTDGFVFPEELLDRPLAGTDPRLHAVILKHLATLTAELPRGETFSEVVTAWLRDALSAGHGDSMNAAAHFGISVRTLSRKLEREGTSFKALLDALRRQLAFHHLSRREQSIAQIARMLGFSEVATFHRAFKRWADKTPHDYRTSVRDASQVLRTRR